MAHTCVFGWSLVFRQEECGNVWFLLRLGLSKLERAKFRSMPSLVDGAFTGNGCVNRFAWEMTSNDRFPVLVRSGRLVRFDG